MQRYIAAVIAIFVVVAGTGWKVAGQSESSRGLDEISLDQGSEHTYASQTEAAARVRVRVSPNDVGFAETATAQDVPSIALLAQ